MAEERFNDSVFGDDWIVSSESIACSTNDQVVWREGNVTGFAERSLAAGASVSLYIAGARKAC